MPTLKEAIVKAKKNAKKDKADKGKKAKPKSSGKSKAAAKPPPMMIPSLINLTLVWSCLLVERLRQKPSIR